MRPTAVTLWQPGDPARINQADALWGGVEGIIVDTVDGGRSALLAAEQRQMGMP